MEEENLNMQKDRETIRQKIILKEQANREVVIEDPGSLNICDGCA